MRSAKKLPEEERLRNDLGTWIKMHSRSWEGVKAKALKAYLDGEHIDDICKVLGVSRQAFWKWRLAVEKEGLKGLETKPRSGRPCRLTQDARETLKRALADSPEKMGYPQKKWTGKLVKQCLEERFEIKVQIRQAQNWMQQYGVPIRGRHKIVHAEKAQAQ